MSNLPGISLLEIKETFDSFDEDKNGYILYDEFCHGCKQLKLPLTHDNLIHVMKIMDTNIDNKISFNEFKSYVIKQDIKIRKIFDKMDIDKSLDISPYEIKLEFKNK